MSEVKMQSPWVVYAKYVKELFAQDPDVCVLFDNDTPKLELLVRGNDKAESISAIMPCEMTFGNVSMTIEVVPDNEDTMTLADHIRRAFGGNPALSDVVDVPIVPGGPCMTYALFDPSATQVEVDNAGSPYGVSTITYEDIAKQVLALEGVMVASELL